jgi:probable rRNA maturation factor
MDEGEGSDAEEAEVMVINQQSEIELDETTLQQQLEIIRAILSVDHYAVTLMLGGDDEIQRLNREFRGVDSPTDILSFSAVDVVEPEKVPLCKHRELCNLGDLVVSVPYVKRQCEADAQDYDGSTAADLSQGVAGLMATGFFTVQERMPLLMIHGMLHLLGHDHEDDEDHELMARRELEVWQEFRYRIAMPEAQAS